MKRIVLFVTVIFLLCMLANAEEKAAPVKNAPAKDKQGISGKVLQMTGNQMPGPDRKASEGAPLSVPVHVFKDKLKPYEGSAKGNASYLCTVNSDKDGNFKVALQPGRYTVVIEYKGKLYLNGFDGQGFWNSVEVKENAWTNVKIIESSSAVF